MPKVARLKTERNRTSTTNMFQLQIVVCLAFLGGIWTQECGPLQRMIVRSQWGVNSGPLEEKESRKILTSGNGRGCFVHTGYILFTRSFIWVDDACKQTLNLERHLHFRYIQKAVWEFASQRGWRHHDSL